jgi:hypothetical protein
MTARDTSQAGISLPPGFHFDEVDRKFQLQLEPALQSQQTLKVADPVSDPPLGVLSNFSGPFHGTGFNLIFRPNNTNTAPFPKPVHPAPPAVPSENTLELNLTQETLSFSEPIGNVPNRGLTSQKDIFLNGVPYLQVINDVTNTATGKADGQPTAIHFEPGLWMHVPATTDDPVLGESLARLGYVQAFSRLHIRQVLGDHDIFNFLFLAR